MKNSSISHNTSIYSELLPQNLNSMEDVTGYWLHCLHELDEGADDKEVASHMVGVVSNPHNEEWGSGFGPHSHPAYPIVFELAASLELPPDMTGERPERWACIKALVGVLRESYVRDSGKAN